MTEYLENELIERKTISTLLNNTDILLGSDINLTEKHFRLRKYKILFAVIDHLSRNGVSEINTGHILNYLKDYPNQLDFIILSGGDKLIDELREDNDNNFNYYYKTLQKINLINSLIEKGFDVSRFYNPNETEPSKKQKIQKTFEETSPEEMLGVYELSLSEMRSTFAQQSGRVSIKAGDGLEELVSSLRETPKMGYTTSSQKLNTIFRGRRKKKLYLYSAPTGVGKTRIAVADQMVVSSVAQYDYETKTWIYNENPVPSLLITTEMDEKEIQSMILSNISGIPQDVIDSGRYTFDQEEVIRSAIEIIKKSPIYIDYISSFSISDIENSIKKHKQQYNIKIVLFDYIHLSVEVGSDLSRRMGLSNNREDIILTAFSSKLKDLAQLYDIHVHSATQVNREWEKKEKPNENLIAGGKAVANKVDGGAIILPPTAQELMVIEDLKNRFSKTPNLVMHVYKNRDNRYKDIKLFVFLDHGTCRLYDCYATDYSNKLISIPDTIIK